MSFVTHTFRCKADDNDRLLVDVYSDGDATFFIKGPGAAVLSPESVRALIRALMPREAVGELDLITGAPRVEYAVDPSDRGVFKITRELIAIGNTRDDALKFAAALNAKETANA